MTIVFYDTETTGLESAFDQILQFAAVQTDEELNELDRFEIRCRLQPHIIAAPDALRVNRIDVSRLTDPSLPSHYEMVRLIQAKLVSWSPSLFIGYNSIRFDEHFLRQCLYQTLHAPYLTNTNGNSRSDALRMMHAVSTFSPDVINIPVAPDGSQTFKLNRLAPANGFNLKGAHDAAVDVAATIHICRLIAERAPDVWSTFMRFSQKAAAANFIEEEDIFCLFDHFYGRSHAWLVTHLGQNSENSSEHYVFDLGIDPADLAQLPVEDMVSRLQVTPMPMRRIRTNAAPILVTTDEAPDFASGADLPQDELERRAYMLRSDAGLVARLIDAFQMGQEERAPSEHVEQQIYDKFISNADQVLLDRFHEAPWEERSAILASISDARLRRLGQRLIYTERPDLLSDEVCLEYDKARARRLLGLEGEVPWKTLGLALSEIDAALAEAAGQERDFLAEHKSHLLARDADARGLL